MQRKLKRKTEVKQKYLVSFQIQLRRNFFQPVMVLFTFSWWLQILPVTVRLQVIRVFSLVVASFSCSQSDWQYTAFNCTNDVSPLIVLNHPIQCEFTIRITIIPSIHLKTDILNNTTWMFSFKSFIRHLLLQQKTWVAIF